MADLTSLDGLIFNSTNVAENGFIPDFTQPDGTVAAGGAISIPYNGAMFFSDSDTGNPDQQQITDVDTSTATSYRLGTLVLNDITALTAPVTCDIIGVNSGGFLLGVTDPQDPYNPDAPDGNFYADGYIYISNTDISYNDGFRGFPISVSGAASASNTYNPPCFAAGTRIGTPDGFALVENLKAGDMVTTASGEPKALVWVGLRDVDIARHPSPELVRPIRISTGAFADSVPSRDLLVSPDHNLFVEGVLIPAKCLVNGASVRQVDMARVTYHHIELAEHDLVVADGMVAETYLDTGNRTSFAGEGVVDAHPDFASAPDVNYFAWEAKGCARLVLSGPEVERAREILAGRVALVFEVDSRAA